MSLFYGFLCGLIGAVVGVGVGIGLGLLIVRLTHMSSFEGKSGYFVAFMALGGGVIGFLAAAVGMSVYFHSRTP